MKKFFIFFTSAAMIFASIAFTACQKQNSKKSANIEEEDETADLITIDGLFTDWEKAKDVVVSNMVPENAGWTQADHQRIDALKTLKAVADANYIYLYMEVDMSINDGGGTNWEGKPFEPNVAGPLDIYFDTDVNNTTGGIYWTWVPLGWECMFESASAFEETIGNLSDGVAFKFIGENQTDVWATNPPAREDISKDGFAVGAGKKEGNIVKYEMKLVRAFIPGLKDKVGIGVLVQSRNWQLLGLQPQIKQETENLVATEVLTINLPA